MKKLIITNLVVFGSVFMINTSLAHAQMGMMDFEGNNGSNEPVVVSEDGHGESIEVVLEEILKEQNVSTVQELDLTKVTDAEWEHLGDAVMELQHPGQAHEAMDQMMGGEGSESLKLMHINMGKVYLGYGNDTYGPGSMLGVGMMGSRSNNTNQWQGRSMMGAGPVGFGSMMGYGGYGAFDLIIWIMWLLFLGSGTYYFIKKANKK